MSEAEWLACTEPNEAWDRLAINASPRQRRLFQCATCRWVWHLLGEQSHRIVEIAERYADGLVESGEFASARQTGWPQELREHSYELWAVQAVVEDDQRMAHAWSLSIGNRDPIRQEDNPEVLKRLSLLCEIIGTPFRPVTISPDVLTWNDGTIVRLAQAAYEERHLPQGTLDNGRLAVLADALEEAGCTDTDILDHLRGPGPHVRGCWAVDIVLGKS